MRFVLTFALLFLSEMVRSEPIGLVLSGGGAKGAYEIGVWKALCEAHLDSQIVAMSGSSVGAINAALFASVRDQSKCERLWRQSVGEAFDYNRNVLQRSLQTVVNQVGEKLAEFKQDGDGAELSRQDAVRVATSVFLESASNVAETVVAATTGTNVVAGVLDSDRVRSVLINAIPDGVFVNAPSVYAVALNKKTNVRKDFLLNGLERAQVVDRLLASAAMPLAFDTVDVEGEKFMDGGYELMGGDNVPVMTIVKNHSEIKTIVVVYLRSAGKGLRRITKEDFPGIRFVEVIPSENIGGFFGMFNASKSKTDALISLGYRDAKSVLIEARGRLSNTKEE